MTTRIIEKNTAAINVLTDENRVCNLEATIYFTSNDTLTEVQAEQLASVIVKLLESNDRDTFITNLINANKWKPHSHN